MEENGDGPDTALSRREGNVSGGAARPHQEREDAICQSW